MKIKYHIETAWEHCIGHVKSLVILTLAVAAVSFISIGILAPTAFAGYTYSLFQLLKYNRPPKAMDVFSQLRLFVPLLTFSCLVFIITFIGFNLLVIPGIVFSLIIGYICLYMIPVMVDLDYGLMDALKKSISILTHANFTDHTIVFIIFFILTTIGGFSLIGFLFLQPFATLFLLSVYDSEKQR